MTQGTGYHGYEELKELARFCLIVGIPFSQAKKMTDEERSAFTEVYIEIQDKAAKAAKRR